MKKTILIFGCLLLFNTLLAQQGLIKRTSEKSADFTDPRDGQQYETVTYTVTYPDNTGESFTWMTKNLNYKMEGAYAYKDTEENRKTHGLLYTWDAAQKACPSGWHLPSDEEWYHLAFHFGGNCKCGKALKSDSAEWRTVKNKGTNKSLFNALPSGMGSKNGTYYRLGWMAIFWSSNERNASSAWDWKLTSGDELQRWHGSKKARNSVRCVKNSN
jgi:uncharacterized protein (TIGR02145 family)